MMQFGLSLLRISLPNLCVSLSFLPRTTHPDLAKSPSPSQHTYAPFFETTIRYLGGLLSAYALSKEPILLARADDLGRMLLPVFSRSSSGLPAYSINTEM